MLVNGFPKFFAQNLDGDAAPSKALKDAAIRKTKGKK